MTLVITAGMRLTAARLNRLNPITAEKPGDTSRSSVTAKTADPDLVLALAINTTYEVRGLLIVTSAANAAGDFSYDWGFPANAVVSAGGVGLHNTLASGSQSDLEGVAYPLDASSPVGSLPYGASTSNSGISVNARVKMGSTAGNLELLWAQVASNANATTLKGGSFITAYPVTSV